ncbi:hypothetical protein V6N11_014482 [Hibiscus sabdariffa]|uniref:F-box domain-containing protein n=1 Tax=Hibiscus sabdariffa TaxID=183260 RepID=A0ABR1ZWE2_9ROSI
MARGLPEMLVLDILSKLPVKSLTRFKCVCKLWSSSFQTPLFITQHHHNHLTNDHLNHLVKRCDGETLSDLCYFSQLSAEKGQDFSLKQNIHLPVFEIEYYTHDVKVHGPQNGILCLVCDVNICLWNPSTREFKILPQSSNQRLPSAARTRFAGLGFGYDSQTDDYKVVRFIANIFEYDCYGTSCYDHTTVQVELYSLKGNSWKEISDPMISEPDVGVCDTTLPDNYVNGFYYWHSYDDSILSFDMVNERFSTLPLPGFNLPVELINYNGLLGAIVYPRQGTPKSFDLWVMNGFWTKQFSIESVPGVERPLGFWKNGELFLESSDNELVLFDPSTREFKNLGIHSYKETQMVAYVESLVPINGRSEHEEHVIRRTVEDKVG